MISKKEMESNLCLFLHQTISQLNNLAHANSKNNMKTFNNHNKNLHNNNKFYNKCKFNKNKILK